MHIYIYLHTYAYAYICTRTHMRMHDTVHTPKHWYWDPQSMHKYAYTHKHKCMSTHTYIYTYTHAYIYIYTCPHTYTHTHMYTHTYKMYIWTHASTPGTTARQQTRDELLQTQEALHVFFVWRNQTTFRTSKARTSLYPLPETPIPLHPPSPLPNIPQNSSRTVGKCSFTVLHWSDEQSGRALNLLRSSALCHNGPLRSCRKIGGKEAVQQSRSRRARRNPSPRMTKVTVHGETKGQWKNDQTLQQPITQSRKRGAQTTSTHLHWCRADPPSSWPTHVTGHRDKGHAPKWDYIFAIFAGFFSHNRPNFDAMHSHIIILYIQMHTKMNIFNHMINNFKIATFAIWNHTYLGHNSPRRWIPQNMLLRPLQFTCHFIDFVFVEINQSESVGSNSSVILVRQTCAQTLSMALGSKRRALTFHFLHRVNLASHEFCSQARFLIESRHCAAAYFLQVPDNCTDLDLILLNILTLKTYTRFSWKNKMLALGVCFPQTCLRAGRRFAASSLRSHLNFNWKIGSFQQKRIRWKDTSLRIINVTATLRYKKNDVSISYTLHTHIQWHTNIKAHTN